MGSLGFWTWVAFVDKLGSLFCGSGSWARPMLYTQGPVPREVGVVSSVYARPTVLVNVKTGSALLMV